MALPAGALTATVTAGGSVGVAGTAATVSELTVALDLPAAHGSRSGSPRLVWGATGVGIESIAERPAAPVTDSLTVLADQPGVLASSTVDGQPALVEIRGWPLVARWRVTMGNESRVHVRRFSAPAAGTTVDLDMLPEAGVPTPATITYAQTITIGAGSSMSDTKTVHTITAAASVTVSTAYAVNKLTMTQNTTITPSLTAGSDPITALHLSGAFTPTFAASIKWPDGIAPTYTSPAVYVFLTVDGGTTWQGVQSGKAFA